MYYGYDASGNLVHSEGSSADGRVAGQVLDLDENSRVVGIHYANGDDTAITYDADGNPETLDNGGESPFEYIYDGTNRLVAVRQGDRIVGSHVYTPTESDLRLQLDNRTMRVGANALRQSTSIGDVLSLLYARPYGSAAGVARFDPLTRSFDLPTEFGITLPDAVAANSLVRRKLVDIDDGDVRRRVDFDRPSNVMFVPPEYATINCGIGCTFNGITLRANGSTGPISVYTGAAVSLLASKNSGSGCDLLLCTFYDNGSPIPSGGLNSTSTAFFTAGTHIVAAGCECSPCDIFGDDTVTINVVLPPPPASCDVAFTDQSGVSAVLQWPVREPYERGVTMFCAGPNVITYGYYSDSFGIWYSGVTVTNDPCATAITRPTNWVAAAHSHPFFTTPAQYRAGVGCRGDRSFLTVDELNGVNSTNANFGSGDTSNFSSTGKPLYMRVPNGDRVKKLLGTTVTTVYP